MIQPCQIEFHYPKYERFKFAGFCLNKQQMTNLMKIALKTITTSSRQIYISNYWGEDTCLIIGKMEEDSFYACQRDYDEDEDSYLKTFETNMNFFKKVFKDSSYSMDDFKWLENPYQDIPFKSYDSEMSQLLEVILESKEYKEHLKKVNRLEEGQLRGILPLNFFDHSSFETCLCEWANVFPDLAVELMYSFLLTEEREMEKKISTLKVRFDHYLVKQAGLLTNLCVFKQKSCWLEIKPISEILKQTVYFLNETGYLTFSNFKQRFSEEVDWCLKLKQPFSKLYNLQIDSISSIGDKESTVNEFKVDASFKTENVEYPSSFGSFTLLVKIDSYHHNHLLKAFQTATETEILTYLEDVLANKSYTSKGRFSDSALTIKEIKLNEI